jgi:hypothetical protein
MAGIIRAVLRAGGQVSFGMLLLLLLPVVVAHAQVTVPSGQFPTIQSAINAIGVTLAPGTIINLLGQQYVEALVIGGPRAFTVQGVPGSTVIHGNGSTPVFINQSPGPIVFAGVTLTGATVSGRPGGGFLVNESSRVTFTNCLVVGNSSTIAGGGGGVVASMSVVINSCTFQSNSAGVDGGGLYVESSQITCQNCTFRSNGAAQHAGGLRGRVSANLTVSGGLFESNSAGGFGGGAMFTEGSLATFTGVTIRNNVSGGSLLNGVGGGVAFSDSSGVFQSSLITGNQSVFAGGALYAFGTFGSAQSGLIVQDSEISSNTTSRKPGAPLSAVGGGIHVEDNVQAQVIRTDVHDNTADGGGGFSVFRGRLAIDSSFVERNHAAGTSGADVAGQGGALLAGSAAGVSPTIDIADSVLRNNTAVTFGGGILVAGDTGANATLNLSRVLVDGNTAAQGRGGGIHTDGANVTINSSQIFRNRAQGSGGDGGGLSLITSSTVISASTLANNTAALRGGGLFAAANGSLTVTTSHVYANTAGSGSLKGGGGIFIGGPAPVLPGSVQTSVVADNSSPQIKEDSSCSAIGYVANSLAALAGGDFFVSSCASPGTVTTATQFDTVPNHGGNNGNPPTFVSFAARPGTGNSVLAFSAARAASVTISPGIGVLAGATGTTDVSVSCPTTYTLTSSNNHSASASVVPEGGSTPVPVGGGFFAYDPSFSGGVFVATGTVNGGAKADVLTGAGPGGGPNVRVFDGITQGLIRNFFAYQPGFTGGVFVAAGDLNGDGNADIITGVGVGGGPDVRIFDGQTGALISEFFPYDPGFRGGVLVAAGDVDGDGRAEIVTAPGQGGGPHVKIFKMPSCP